MFKSINILTNIKFGVAAAVLFCIPVLIYISDDTYTKSWLIYLGSALFCGVITVYTLFFNKTKEDNANTVQLIIASQVTVVIGVMLSCVLCFVLLSSMVPGYLHSGTAVKVDNTVAPAAIGGRANGIGFRVFVGALLINFIYGAFVGSILSFSAKRDQTKNSGSSGSIQQRG